MIITKDEDFAVHLICTTVLPSSGSESEYATGGAVTAIDAELPKIISALERGETLIELA